MSWGYMSGGTCPGVYVLGGKCLGGGYVLENQILHHITHCFISARTQCLNPQIVPPILALTWTELVCEHGHYRSSQAVQ